jgi:ATP-binding cassette subfamily B protein
VREGETIAIVGESGSGKSTILNLVIGFNLAQEGQVLVDGLDIKEIDLHSYRKHIAIVPQNSVLFTGTIRENITYGILMLGHIVANHTDNDRIRSQLA